MLTKKEKRDLSKIFKDPKIIDDDKLIRKLNKGNKCFKENSTKKERWKLGEIVFDDKNDTISLEKYSWQTMSELFCVIAMYIGLSLEEFAKNKEIGIPQWCFDDLHIKYKDEDTGAYSDNDCNKAMKYFKKEINRVSKLFLKFAESENEEDAEIMFNELKKIYLSLWD